MQIAETLMKGLDAHGVAVTIGLDSSMYDNERK